MSRYLRDFLHLIPLEIFGEIFALILERLEPFVFLNEKNREKLIEAIGIINNFDNIDIVYPLLNSLILSVTDINYKYLLEYILFLLKYNNNEIRNDVLIRQTLLISMLKLMYEYDRSVVHELMTEFRNKNLKFSVLV